MQIKTRITMQFIIVVTLLFAAVFAVIYYSSFTYRRSEFYERLRNKAVTTADLFAKEDRVDSTMLILLDRIQRDKLRAEKVIIMDFSGNVLFDSNDTIPLAYNSSMLAKIRENNVMEFVAGDNELLGMTYESGNDRYILMATAYDYYGYSKLGNLQRTLLLLFFLLITFVAVTGWIYAGRALRPLSDLVHEVEVVDVNRLNTRLHKSSNNDEIGRLITAFNTLLDQIENTFKLQRIFVSGASHELKNPLTSITSQLQVVLLKDRPNEEYRTLIRSILEDIRNLNRTTGDLMEYARLNYEDEIALTTVRVDDVIWQCSEELLKAKTSYQIQVSFGDMPADAGLLEINGNAALLKIAFSNVVDNACKFSSDRTCLVQMETQKENIVVRISDHGIGLSEQEINYIFEPFYRANSTTEVAGHGIGLALTKKILQLHQASITVQSRENTGTMVTIVLPIRKR